MSSIRRKVLNSGLASWEARVNVKGHPALSKSFPSKKEAAEWAAVQEVRIRGGDKVVFKADKVLVRDALQAYLANFTQRVVGADGVEVEVCSLPKGKQYAIGSVVHHLGDFAVGNLTDELITKFLVRLQATAIPQPANKKKSHPLYQGDRVRTYSPSAVRKLFYALKTAIEWHASKFGYRSQIVGLFMQVDVPPAWEAPRERRLEEGEEQRLMAACDGMYKDPRAWQLLIGLALETAMRAGELIGMLWSEVNVEHRFIAIPKEREKTRRGRQIPLSSKALAILDELRRRRKNDAQRVFATLPQNTDQLGHGFKRIVHRAGCEDLRFHDLRHEATSRFFENTPLQTLEVAMITGHTEEKTLQRYANLRPKMLAEKLDAGPNWA